MTVLVNCFRCGKAVLVRPEQTTQTPYCFSCRNSLGLPDPPEEEPTPAPTAPAPKKQPKLSAPPPVKKAELDRDPPVRNDEDMDEPKKRRSAVDFPLVKEVAPERDRSFRKDDEDEPRSRRASSEVPVAKEASPERDRSFRKDDDEDDDEPRRRPSGGLAPGAIIGIVLGGVGVLTLIIIVAVMAGRSGPTPPQFAQPRNPAPQWPNPPVIPPIVNPDPVVNPIIPPPIQPVGDVPLVRTIAVSNVGVWSVAFRPDGATLATASGYLNRAGEVQLWSAATGELSPDTPSIWKPSSDLFGVAFRSDGNALACAAGNNGISVIAFPEKSLGGFSPPHRSYVRGVAYAPNGVRLASVCERNVKVWDLTQPKELWSLNLAPGDLPQWRIPTRLAFSPDSAMLAVGNGGRDVNLHDAGTGQVIRTLQGHAGTVVCTSFSPNGQFLASGSFDGAVKTWNPASGREMETLKGHGDWVFCVAFASDNRTLASAGRDGSVVMWDILTGDRLATLAAHKKEVGCVAFSPQGNLLATSSIDGTVKLWDVSRLVGAR
jgi:WD domain, G-beta repeat